jgi:hypothetical protein
MKRTNGNDEWAKREWTRIRQLCREADDLTVLHTREAAHYARLADTEATMVRIDLSEGYVDGNVQLFSAKAARMMDTMSPAERKLAAAGALPGIH